MSRLSGLTGQKVATFSSVSVGGKQGTDVTVVGAKVGDFAFVSSNVDTADMQLRADVDAPDTVRVTVYNNAASPVNMNNATLYVVVVPRDVMGHFP